MQIRLLAATVLKWAGRILLAVLVVALLALGILLVREQQARASFAARYPPPGRMVSLSSHEMHLQCVGHGSPVVVFESDLDPYGSLSWDSVLGPVGQYTRACAYDRAGIVWSKPGPLPRDGNTIAGELHTLLQAAGERGPYVLVGHAFGGIYARIFAGQNPAEVCGIVLVDSSHPDMLERFAAVGYRKAVPERGVRPVIWLLSYLGSPGRFQGPRYGLPANVYEAQQAYLPVSSVAWYDESVEARASLAQAGRVTTLGDIPLAVLASARPTGVSATAAGGNLQQVWLVLQEDLATLSTDSRFVPLPDSGHYIQFDRPDLVAEAIEAAAKSCRARPPSP